MSEKKLDIIISNYLKELGVSASLKGYYYLRYAIRALINDGSLIRAVTKELYPMIAKEFKTTPSRAERNIRHAIETGWKSMNEQFAKDVFSYGVFQKGKPTNNEFLAEVADHIIITHLEGNTSERM